ncbi:MAG: N-acetylmuramoyl-L-alanine amidase [Clostridia bacterium]|nr:N-acetylmuramoyl-L-alanine amidase [Clostridia bacterium]
MFKGFKRFRGCAILLLVLFSFTSLFMGCAVKKEEPSAKASPEIETISKETPKSEQTLEVDVQDDKDETVYSNSDTTASKDQDKGKDKTGKQESGEKVKNTPLVNDRDKESPEKQPESVKKTGGYEILRGKTICIDSGHQSRSSKGQEPIAPNTDITKEKMVLGTSGVATGIPEYKLNMNVSQKLKRELLKLGVKVYMTHESNDIDISNIERAEFANSTNAELVVRIHADGSDNPKVKGMSMLVPGSKYVKDQALLQSSRKAGAIVLKSLIEKTGAKSRGVIERDDLTGFNWSTRPVILIEMGFMSNPEEDKFLNTDSYQEKIVEGIVEGLANYFQSVKE